MWSFQLRMRWRRDAGSRSPIDLMYLDTTGLWNGFSVGTVATQAVRRAGNTLWLDNLGVPPRGGCSCAL